MFCRLCEFDVHRGHITAAGDFFCESCAQREIYECEDCGHVCDASDLGTYSMADGPTVCPDCRAADSFKEVS